MLKLNYHFQLIHQKSKLLPVPLRLVVFANKEDQHFELLILNLVLYLINIKAKAKN